MHPIRLTAILTLCTSLISCSLTYRDTIVSDPKYNPHRSSPEFKGRSIVDFDMTTLPNAGAYYQFVFSEDRQTINNITSLLSDLYSRGFEISHAWHYPGGTCRPIGANYETGTIYRQSLVLHLHQPDEGLMTYFKFRQIPKPKTFTCPYFIVEYTPSIQN